MVMEVSIACVYYTFKLKALHIIYINSVNLCVCDGGFGGWGKGEAGEATGAPPPTPLPSLSRSRMSVCRGPETQILNCKSKITAQKPAWLLFS